MDLNNFLEGIERLLALLFPDGLPPWLLNLIWGFIVFALALFAFVAVLDRLKTLWRESIQPIVYDREKLRRQKRRRQFADHIEGEIRRLNDLEDWSDHRFAELEAEVETEGKSRRSKFIPFVENRPDEKRRERSLSHAIAKSNERLLLLEGEPGAGKSVALRHVAQTMAAHARNSRNLKTVIPLYINLRDLNPAPGEKIDSRLIENFVLATVNRANNRDVEAFLDDEFRTGMHEGTWLFLFDSFDEIPAILSSTFADDAIRTYADAISDFLRSFNQCRGVVASREYRGPRRLGWPRFRILQLTAKRREQLVHNSQLPSPTQDIIVAGLATASADFRVMASNPMFLGLLCEYMRAMSPQSFPDNTYPVFDAYLTNRFRRDAERVFRRYGIPVGNLRNAAEDLAFAMTASQRLGLNPELVQLLKSMKLLGFDPERNLTNYIDALEYIKIAKPSQSSPGSPRTFTFAHRRIQEYFATTVVLREPDRITPNELLTNARWRETAVVLLQNQSENTVVPLVKSAVDLLYEAAIEIAKGLGLKSVDEKNVLREIAVAIGSSYQTNQSSKLSTVSIEWPPYLLHVLGIIQDGFVGKRAGLPEKVGAIASAILEIAFLRGSRLDQLWVVQVAGAATTNVMIRILRHAIASPSRIIQDLASSQVARLGRTDKVLTRRIAEKMIALGLHLFAQRRDLAVQFARFDNPKPLLSALHCLLWAPWIELGLLIVVFVLSAGITETGWAFAAFGLWLWSIFVVIDRWAPTNRLTILLGLFPSFGGLALLGRSVLLLVNEPQGFPDSGMLFLVIWLYQVSWGYAVFSTINTGGNTHALYWLLFPFLRFSALLKSAVSVIPHKAADSVSAMHVLWKFFYDLARKEYFTLPSSKETFRWLRSQLVWIGAIILTFALSAVQILGAILVLGYEPDAAFFVVYTLDLVVAVPLLLIIWISRRGPLYLMEIFKLVLAKIRSSELLILLSDWSVLRKWQAAAKQPMQFAELTALFQQRWAQNNRMAVLLHVRKKQLLEATPEAESTLKVLIVHATNDLNAVNPFRTGNILKIDEVPPWKRKLFSHRESQIQTLRTDFLEIHPQMHPWLSHWWTDDELDELLRLVEQVQQSSK